VAQNSVSEIRVARVRRGFGPEAFSLPHLTACVAAKGVRLSLRHMLIIEKGLGANTERRGAARPIRIDVTRFPPYGMANGNFEGAGILPATLQQTELRSGSISVSSPGPSLLTMRGARSTISDIEAQCPNGSRERMGPALGIQLGPKMHARRAWQTTICAPVTKESRLSRAPSLPKPKSSRGIGFVSVDIEAELQLGRFRDVARPPGPCHPGGRYHVGCVRWKQIPTGTFRP
jgi:hypothetical protein